MDWIYAGSEIRPKQNEEVLCDLGKDFNFSVMVYDEGIFYDTNIGEYYNIGTDIKRWCHIGKHCDEQF